MRCMVSDDIAWFSPVELRTKWGRRGHIKEGLGKSEYDGTSGTCWIAATGTVQ